MELILLRADGGGRGFRSARNLRDHVGCPLPSSPLCLGGTRLCRHCPDSFLSTQPSSQGSSPLDHGQPRASLQPPVLKFQFYCSFSFPSRDPWRSFTPKPSDLSALLTCRFKSLCQISGKHTAFQKTSTMTSYSVALKKIRPEIPGPMLELKIDLKRHI